MGELRKIPGVGKKTEKDLIMLGYKNIESLKGEDPEKIYLKECEQKGCKVDRCQLYVYRCAVYYANGGEDRENKKWWDFKDK